MNCVITDEFRKKSQIANRLRGSLQLMPLSTTNFLNGLAVRQRQWGAFISSANEKSWIKEEDKGP